LKKEKVDEVSDLR
jgi:hypothetical protein